MDMITVRRHRIGFTGTRFGMTAAQLWVVTARLKSQPERFEAHHGDCVGADSDFHQICRNLGAYIVVHPPVVQDDRARCIGDEMRGMLPYMRRNANIVSACDEMIATPREASEQERGGTWRTVQLARKAKKLLTIVWPDGSALVEPARGQS